MNTECNVSYFSKSVKQSALPLIRRVEGSVPFANRFETGFVTYLCIFSKYVFII